MHRTIECIQANGQIVTKSFVPFTHTLQNIQSKKINDRGSQEFLQVVLGLSDGHFVHTRYLPSAHPLSPSREREPHPPTRCPLLQTRGVYVSL